MLMCLHISGASLGLLFGIFSTYLLIDNEETDGKRGGRESVLYNIIDR